MSAVTSAFSKLNPFSKARRSHEDDDEDVGEEIDQTSLAGGGHAGRQTVITSKIGVSTALRSFLVHRGVLNEIDAGLDNPDQVTPTLRALLDKPHIQVPRELTDRSHPLPNYFISSSHNTYLLAHQLYGSSSATAYDTALKAGARCVEIDAWNSDNKEEPKVTHGFTLTSNIPFRKVCEAIRDVVDHEAQQSADEEGNRAAPVLLSLENHCDAYGQQRLAAIMREVFGHRLLTKPVRDKGTREQEGTGEHVTLGELESKISVIVEYHFPDEPNSDADSDSSDSEDNDEKKARHDYKDAKKQTATNVIAPELAELGIYAQSVKPPSNAWFEKGVLEGSPHHPLINVSESGLSSHMPDHNALIARHNSHHLMRVYPKGTRISSRNLKPVPFWAVGAQICAMNWQTFGASMQLNEALFSGTDGYVLKPAPLRVGGNGQLSTNRRKKLRLHVAGASDLPVPADKADEIKPYFTCTLVPPDDLTGDDPPKRKTSPYKQHKLGFLHKGDNPKPTEPVWDEVLEWEYQHNELVFLRMLIKSDDSFARNPIYAVAAVRLLYAQTDQWVFVRMLDLHGRETKCAVLLKFEIVDS